LIWMLASPN